MRESSFQPINRDFLELSIGYGLIMIAVWSPLPVQRVLFWVTFSWILSATLLSRQDRDTLGLGFRRIHRSLWVIGVAVLLAAAQMVISMHFGLLHPMFGSVPVGRHMWGYLVWAFLQQFVLQDFFLLRLLRLMPSPKGAVITAASLFAIAHLPNPLLTVATLLWGLAACSAFLKYRSLYPLGLIHGILGLCIAISVPNAVHHHMRVGLGYLRYNADQSRRANAAKPRAGDLAGGTIHPPATVRPQ